MAVHDTLAEVIGAMGEAHFPRVAAEALRVAGGFDLAALVVHGERADAAVLFDNFDAAGRRGLATYAQVTRRINPLLAQAPRRAVVRARDFRAPLRRPSREVATFLQPAVDEELGFRTFDWPPRLEEVGLWLDVWDGVVELGLYRERSRCAAADEDLGRLPELAAPVAAALEAHHRWLRPRRHSLRGLSPREREICDLLLEGCSTEAVALRLGISRYTVKDHRKQIFRKLGVGSLQALFAVHR